jgi:predicted nuclease of predicted toxin-antitoxin system
VAIEGLSLLVYLDHNVDPLLAQDARKAGCDAVAALEVGNAALADADHLSWAAEHGRCIITHDYDDYPRLAAEWFFAEQDHPCIILCRQPPDISHGEMLRRLLRLLDTLTGDEMVNRLEWLDDRWSDATGGC